MFNIFRKKEPSFDEQMRLFREFDMKLVNELEVQYEKCSDYELEVEIHKIKEGLPEGVLSGKALRHIMAIIREIVKRVLDLRLFDVQLKGALSLGSGNIVEMQAGEGKTLVVMISAIIQVLQGSRVHIMTYNEYLAERDNSWMGKVLDMLGISHGVISSGLSCKDRKSVYEKDVIYASYQEFIFDYLRDNVIVDLAQKVQKGFDSLIVDEADSILLDRGKTPIVLSKEIDADEMIYEKANDAIFLFSEEDYEVNADLKMASLTMSGASKAEEVFDIEDLSTLDNIKYNNAITFALGAHKLFEKDIDYVVADGILKILNSSTVQTIQGIGCMDGFYRALEVKEGLDLTKKSHAKAKITLKEYLRLYSHSSGIAAAVKSSVEELREIYGFSLDVLQANKKSVRVVNPYRVYVTKNQKYFAIAEQIETEHLKGRPVLVSVPSVKESEKLSNILKEKEVNHGILNAKNERDEAMVISQAGKYGCVTIVVNAAGHGTDIVLGGDYTMGVISKLREKYGDAISNEHDSFAVNQSLLEADVRVSAVYDEYEKKLCLAQDSQKSNRKKVIDAGGLCVINAEKNILDRHDKQLSGRSARRGAPGSSSVYLSLEDSLFKRFVGKKTRSLIKTFAVDGEIIKSKVLSNALVEAQKKANLQDVSLRKKLVKYNEVYEAHREKYYSERQRILSGEICLQSYFVENIDRCVEDILGKSFVVDNETGDKAVYISRLVEAVQKEFSFNLFEYYRKVINRKDVRDFLNSFIWQNIEERFEICEEVEEEGVCGFKARMCLLKKEFLVYLDLVWEDHIEKLSELQKGIHLRVYGKENPLDRYVESGDFLLDETTRQMLYGFPKEVLKNYLQ